MTEARSQASRRGVGFALPLVGVAMLVVVVALYATRKAIAREALLGWLRSHGVAAEAQVQDLGFGRFAGQVRVGDPKAPDFVAGDATITWGLRGFGLDVRSVTLRRPTLRARLHDGKLSLGALDPLIAEFRKKPPQPGTPEPRINVEGGVLLLATDDGPVRLAVDAAMRDGRLTSLSAASAPTRLRGATFDATLGAGTATLRTLAAGRIDLAFDAPVKALAVGGYSAKDARLQLAAQTPYPDLKTQRIDGAVTLRADLTGAFAGPAARRLDGAQLTVAVKGQAAGGLVTLALAGQGSADLKAAGGAMGATQFGAVRAAAKADDLRWTRQGGDALAATPAITAVLQDLAAGDLRLQQAMVRLQGPVAYGPGGARAALVGSVGSWGGWHGLGAPTAADAPQLAALKRAAAGFQVDAPGLALEVSGAGTRIGLPKPLRLRPYRGGELKMSARDGAPVFGPNGGALRISMNGGGLPTVEADVRRLTVANGALTVRGAVKAGFSIGPVETGTAVVSGLLKAADGGLSFAADGCAPIVVGKLELGANDLERIAANLCPAGGPMFTLAKGTWRLNAKAEGLAADAPFLQARVSDGAGSIVASQSGGALAVATTFDNAQVTDLAPATRFNPLKLHGTAGLNHGVWAADLTVTGPAGLAVATTALKHDVASGQGGVVIDTGALRFANGELQPIQLSPLADALGSPVTGSVRFAGHFNWTLTGVASGGTLTVAGLDFQSPAGRVGGLKGAIAFTSLAPLVAAPGQTLSADNIAAIVPITGVTAAFALDQQTLTITGGQAAVGGGLVRIERLSVPLVKDAPVTGVLDFDAVQLHDLVEASPFGDRVDLDARVSGRVPFESRAGTVRIASAELHAVQPGRLSIQREALTGVAAGGSVAAPKGPVAAVPANDTFTDFAYQAMENLAFDTLSAAVASRPDGRLGVLAHIVGRHDPPQRQEIKLSLFDLIGRKFLNRPLPLPSDTGVDLTLDTTLNLDDLLTDYADYQRLRGSHPVQSAGPKPQAKPMETTR